MDDLIIVGAGWAGLTAAAVALKLKPSAKIRLIAQGIGSPIVAPGWISVWESAQGNLFDAVRDLVARVPDHPYALAGVEALDAAADFFIELSAKLNLFYAAGLNPLTNVTVKTALGGEQHAALVPAGYDGAHYAGEAPLYVGFEGWRDYYPALSGPRTATIRLPMTERPWDLTPTDLARAFDRPDFRDTVAALVNPHLVGVTSVGFPAVLGLEDSAAVIADLEHRFAMPVFEIPTLPPSVPGTRFFNAVRRHLLDNHVRVQIGHPVQRGLIEKGRAVGVEVAAAGKPQAFRARAVILATGGLYGGGLFSDDRGRLWEPVFGLPVDYDPDRTRWFNEHMLDPRGHPVHHFGVRANARMQPLDARGAVVADGLYVAGHILAHPDTPDAPPPLETAEGVALATAYKATQCALETL